MMILRFISILILFFNPLSSENLKVLHLSFHSGCIKDFEGVANELGFDVTSCQMNIEPSRWDPHSNNNSIYNIGHDRAERIYNRHKEYFESFDLIITSDTAPLSRIFLQHKWKKPLIIWICNRFDYYDAKSLDCNFPDLEYYQLFEKAKDLPNVRIAAYNDFERHYCLVKGIDIGNVTIKPSIAKVTPCTKSLIPPSINKSETFFLPPYHNETIFMNLEKKCKELNIPVYNGRYNGPDDLRGFKGIIHLPYAWSNLALFENITLGIPYFIPTTRFIQKLASKGNYFIPNDYFFFKLKLFALSEWYGDEFKDLFTYFDSWEDLRSKVKTADFPLLEKKIKERSIKHREETINRWKELIESCLSSF